MQRRQRVWLATFALTIVFGGVPWGCAASNGPIWPPVASGNCSSPAECGSCLASKCSVPTVCTESKMCAASLACVNSTLSANHVANTPTNCQSIDCVLPCFPTTPISGAPGQEYAVCAAQCLRQSVVPPAQPQQVHLAFAGANAGQMTVSWVTDDFATASTVVFGQLGGGHATTTMDGTNTNYSFDAGTDTFHGTFYKQGLYRSGLIHHTTLTGLKPSTTYWYRCGGPVVWSQNFSFTTSPPVGRSSLPYVFGITGDLGQTNDSLVNVRHFAEDPTLGSIIHVGDLSYADSQMMRWESWGRMVEPVAARKAWMIAAGNHEVEHDSRSQLPDGDVASFNTYQHRFKMPSAESGGTSGNSWYSYNVAGVHVFVLNAYTDTSVGSPQYDWLEHDLKSIDRTVTPWVISSSHCPWYNSNKAHHEESQAVSMQKAMEPLFAKYGVDIAFAGHVHAYERNHKILNNATVSVGPDAGTVYINIGDGGNREGAFDHWLPGLDGRPEPAWSAVRQGIFGHGRLELVNGSHAQWTWHRTVDGEKVVSDQAWIERHDSGKWS